MLAQKARTQGMVLVVAGSLRIDPAGKLDVAVIRRLGKRAHYVFGKTIKNLMHELYSVCRHHFVSLRK